MTLEVMICFIALCVFVGVLLACLAYSFGKNYTVPILGAVGLFFLAMLISEMYAVTDLKVRGAAALGAALVGCALGCYFNTFVKVAATALAGAFLVTRGLGSCFGGFPAEFAEPSKLANTKVYKQMLKQNEKSAYLWGYMGIFIALFISGAVV